MTKKRFMKLLMAGGYSRNRARYLLMLCGLRTLPDNKRNAILNEYCLKYVYDTDFLRAASDFANVSKLMKESKKSN